jgi:hypothetical protein
MSKRDLIASAKRGKVRSDGRVRPLSRRAIRKVGSIRCRDGTHMTGPLIPS